MSMSSSTDPARKTRNIVLRFLVQARRGVEHDDVACIVYENGGLTARYLMMTVISAAIAVLGLMLSSPAVVIGAMLVSPMMSPIVSLGFSLALLDWDELKRSMTALAVGIGLALTVAILLSLISPLKEPTGEILARTRPNFFDLVIAVFSGVAGAYAVIRQRGETIIGVAIATALMPPVATVGFGLGTGDLGIAAGAFFLFMTNLVAIALAATLTAGFYGFRPRLLERPKPWRGVAVLVVFLMLSVPLVISLRAIGLESQATAETRKGVADIFSGADSRVTLLEARSQGKGVVVTVLVSTRKLVADAEARLQKHLTAALHTPVTAVLDQIVVADPKAAARAVQANTAVSPDPAATLRAGLLAAIPFATDAVMVDPEGRRAIVLLRSDAGLDLAGAFAFEKALMKRYDGVAIWVLPPVETPSTVDLGDPTVRERTVWALARWRAVPALQICRPALGVPAADGTRGPDAGEIFRSELAAAGVTVRLSEGTACKRADVNLARLSLD